MSVRTLDAGEQLRDLPQDLTPHVSFLVSTNDDIGIEKETKVEQVEYKPA